MRGYADKIIENPDIFMFLIEFYVKMVAE